MEEKEMGEECGEEEVGAIEWGNSLDMAARYDTGV